MPLPLEMRLKAFQTTTGFAPSECTVNEWLTLAIDADLMANDCGPFDPAFPEMAARTSRFMNAAALREEIDAKGTPTTNSNS